MQEKRPIPWSRLFVEGVAIVVSILLAFWIDAWWDDRQASRQEREMLLSLETEFEDLRERLDFWAGFNRETVALIERFLSAEAASMTQDQVENLLQRASISNVLDLGGPLEGLIYSGRLEQISDHEIRARLAKWPDWLEDIHTNDLSVRDYAMREIAPWLARRGIPRRLCPDREYSCGPNTPVEPEFLALAGDPELRAHLVTRRWVAGIVAEDHADARDEADAILAMIARRVHRL